MTALTIDSSSLPQKQPSEPEPTHPNLIRVRRGSQPFSSAAISLVSLHPKSLFASVHPHSTPARDVDYTTVQTSPTDHLALNSDLVYCNHSCDPSLVFDMGKGEVRVVENRKLQVGDDLTFFYPSSEWDMRQPFQCQCQRIGGVEEAAGSQAKSKCLGWIAGAKHLDEEVLNKYWLNKHIWDLMERRRVGEAMGEGDDKAVKEVVPN